MQTLENQPQNHGSRLQQLQKLHVANQKFILAATGLSADDYNMHFFETGCQLIDQLFPQSSQFAKYRNLHLQSRIYWVWWRAEWQKWEREFMQMVREDKLHISAPMWYEEMSVMAHDGHVEQSFNHSYLKTSNHVII